MLFITWRPLLPRFNVVITVATVFLLPLVLEPFLNYLTHTAGGPLTMVQIMAATSILPAILPVIYLLDYNLKQNAQDIRVFARGRPKGRNITTISKALFAATLALLLVSLTLNNPALLLTSILFALYLLAILIRVLSAIPRLPLDVPTIWKRVIAGTTVNVSLYATSRSSISLHSLLSPADPWVKVTPQRFTLSKAKAELSLTATPSLAGPSHPQLQVSVIDPWGFIQVNHLLEPMELHVIPRAKYAEWLAKRYLEQTGAGAAADKLAFNLITTALTFAHETIPTALTVYNQQRVVLTTTVIDPREILKQTLSLIKDITSVEFTHRFLQLPDISKLRRDISQLKQATSEPAQRLLSMLNFEYQAIEKAAKNQPATLALSSVTEHAPARAIIVLISQMNHDAEALLVTTEKLSRREFSIIPIETK